MNRSAAGVVFLFIILIAILAATPPALAQESKIVTTVGQHRIVILDPGSGHIKTIFRSDPGSYVTSVTAAADSPRIAFSVLEKKRVLRKGHLQDRRYTMILKDQVWLMRRDGSNVRMLRQWIRKSHEGRVVFPRHNDHSQKSQIENVGLSGDGRKILIVKFYDTFEMKIGKPGLNWLNPPGSGIYDPQYNLSSDSIVAYFRLTDGRLGVGVMPLSTGKPRILRNHRIDTLYAQPSFSPNGKWIAFGAEKSGGIDPSPGYASASAIWLMDRDGNRVHPLRGTQRKGLSFDHPRFSPDGRTIAMSTTGAMLGGDKGLIWLINVDGTGLHPIFSGSVGWLDRIPTWIP